jgi:hypothetical protein
MRFNLTRLFCCADGILNLVMEEASQRTDAVDMRKMRMNKGG